jgi:electron transfer flavoprotein beta subunit
MKILVTIKRTPHRDARMRVAPDGKSLEIREVPFEINPFDEIAVEEALQIKEAGKAQEVVAVTVGPEVAREQLLAALAMGADRGILVNTDQVAEDKALDSLQIAKTLTAVIRTEQPGLVIMGKLATDDENWQIAPMVAELVGWPQATFASKLELAPDGKTARVTREIDAGLEEVELTLPALVTVDLRINEPRYASLPGIMKAKRKPLDVVGLEDLVGLAELGGIGQSRVRTISYRALPPKEKGILVDSAAALATALKERKLV